MATLMDLFSVAGSVRTPWKLATIFLGLFLLGMVFFDQLLMPLVPDPGAIAAIQQFKGWFVLLGAAFCFALLLKREITGHAATTPHLRKTGQDLLDILDAMPVGIALIEDGNVEYVNVNFSERFGYNLDEIPTEDHWLLLAYPDPVYRDNFVTAWRAEVAQARAQGGPIPPFEVRVTCKNGLVRYVIVNTQLVGRRLVMILTDITEREMQQNELIKMEKLESVGVLAGGIAHDFNNILTGIMGNLSYARTILDPEHLAWGAVTAAEKASGRATELTHQLLTFARGGAPVKKTVHVRGLLGEAMSLMLHGANVKGELQVEAEVQAIEADEGQLSQVLNNIIINAVQAMPEGGTLRVTAANERLERGNAPALPPGDYVRITIADEGCGIPQEDMERIFDPYYSTKAFGSGLGLASAYSIVARHGGHISATSVIGRGTTLTLRLPAIGILPEEVPAEVRDLVRHTRQQGQCQVLVMDDEEIIRDIALMMLVHLGYAVKVCTRGEEAVEVYREALAAGQPFDAVIMDLTVPGGMGGTEAAGSILALDADARLIVSSGYSDDPVMADHQAYGFRGVLTKPYNLDELDRVLEEVLAPKPGEVSCR